MNLGNIFKGKDLFGEKTPDFQAGDEANREAGKIKPRLLVRGNLLFVILLIVAFAAFAGVATFRIAERITGKAILPQNQTVNETNKIVREESIVIDIAEKVSPSVVTVSVQTPRRRVLEFSPFGGVQSQEEGGTPRDIGTGFIVSEDGLIITNKHVVSSVANATYKVITKDNKEYDVVQINRDPSNDIAILKIDARGLTPVELGDSSQLRVGQFVIAIGTALGEFRNTVTTGVISGLGRGINAGSVFEGSVERLDNVIQTDAAINPGNSGGPLVNSGGQVIGINVAVASGAENIGFAIPINTVKESLQNFQSTGSFPAKPYIGVQYQMISRETALLNDVPQGAYVVEVIEGSPADEAQIEADDIILEIDQKKLSDVEGGLAEIIASKKSGDNVTVKYWRSGDTIEKTVKLGEAPTE
ncbi:MAG TPA: trypsin-like peptidase domain-containing protein [Patescibacteria group bacterium]